MTIKPKIRAETEADYAAIRAINRKAFGRDDEAKLVDRLRESGLVVASLVAADEDGLTGHALFSRLPVQTKDGVFHAVALGPVAVRPAWQKQGIGAALIRKGLAVCRDSGESAVIVLGHESYYPRFGFSAKAAEKLQGPFSGPSWMALELVRDGLKKAEGTVKYPAAWGIRQ